MAYHVDIPPEQNKHVNYEPSSLNGLEEANKKAEYHRPYVEGYLKREAIERTNNFKQAGERYRVHEDWERDDLINNLVNSLKPCEAHIQQKMVELFTKCDKDYGQRVAVGLGMKPNKDGSMDSEYSKEITPTSGKFPERGGSPMGSTENSDAVQDAKDKGHDGKPY